MKTSQAALILAAVLCLSTPALAQSTTTLVSNDEPETPNLLLVNPGDLLNGIITVEYERALNHFIGLNVGASLYTFRGVFAPEEQGTVVAVGPELGVRFHFIRDAPRGLWVGPSVNFVYVASRTGADTVVDRSFGWGLGAAVGYNFALGKTFVFQLGLGGSVVDYGYGITWAPRLRLGLGGRF